MNIDFYIPEWILWLVGLGIGIPLVVGILMLAWVGWVVCSSMKGGVWR